jgi:hypothetical protein
MTIPKLRLRGETVSKAFQFINQHYGKAIESIPLMFRHKPAGDGESFMVSSKRIHPADSMLPRYRKDG